MRVPGDGCGPVLLGGLTLFVIACLAWNFGLVPLWGWLAHLI